MRWSETKDTHTLYIINTNSSEIYKFYLQQQGKWDAKNSQEQAQQYSIYVLQYTAESFQHRLTSKLSHTLEEQRTEVGGGDVVALFHV
jgi:hypothetical protein